MIAVAAGWLSIALAENPRASSQDPQVTSTPGSPDATTTIDGRYLPPPPQKFEGAIGMQADQSKPYWPATVVPPKGAPNILLIMTDDQGYGVSGTFGRVVPTPAMDRIASMGLRYTQFHSTALNACSRSLPEQTSTKELTTHL